MPNTKISALTQGSPAQGADLIPIARSGSNFSLTAVSMNSPVQSVVSYSATPVFNGSNGNSFQITLTGNVTSSTFSNALTGQLYIFEIIQDGTGGRTFSWPTNLKGAMSITGAAGGPNETAIQAFYFDGTSGIAISPGTVYP